MKKITNSFSYIYDIGVDILYIIFFLQMFVFTEFFIDKIYICTGATDTYRSISRVAYGQEHALLRNAE